MGEERRKENLVAGGGCGGGEIEIDEGELRYFFSSFESRIRLLMESFFHPFFVFGVG